MTIIAKYIWYEGTSIKLLTNLIKTNKCLNVKNLTRFVIRRKRYRTLNVQSSDNYENITKFWDNCHTNIGIDLKRTFDGTTALFLRVVSEHKQRPPFPAALAQRTNRITRWWGSAHEIVAEPARATFTASKMRVRVSRRASRSALGVILMGDGRSAGRWRGLDIFVLW